MRILRKKKKAQTELIKPQMTALVDVLTVLVFFLLKNFSSEGDIITPSKNLELPESSAKMKPEVGLTISISQKHILLDGTPVALVDEERNREGQKIPGLSTLLDEKKKQTETLSDFDESVSFKGQLSIQADRKIPFWILQKVMTTCGEIGYSSFALAVSKKMSTEQLKDIPQKKTTGKSENKYQGGIFDQIDIPIITSLISCFLLFILIIIGIKTVDYSSLDTPKLEELSNRVAKIIMPLKSENSFTLKKNPNKTFTEKMKQNSEARTNENIFQRIDRSKKSASEQMNLVQNRIQKATVLSILSGKGIGTKGKSVPKTNLSKGLLGIGGLNTPAIDLNELVKYDKYTPDLGSNESISYEGKGDLIGSTENIETLKSEFKKAKNSALKKIGIMEFEKPELMNNSGHQYSGNRKLQDVGKYISKKQFVINSIYEERLKTNPGLEGKVTLLLVIEEDGRVSSVTVQTQDSNIEDTEFLNDLILKIKRWVFPPSTGGPIQMKTPFIFRPS